MRRKLAALQGLQDWRQAVVRAERSLCLGQLRSCLSAAAETYP